MPIYKNALDYIFTSNTMLEHGWKDHSLAVRKQAQKELIAIRKIDITETLKYAEEAGAAIEELKHGVEEAIEEMGGWVQLCEQYPTEKEEVTEYSEGHDKGTRMMLNILKKHVSKYLEE